MPIYRVEVTIDVPAWYVTDADDEADAIRAAQEVGPGFFQRDDALMRYTLDAVVLDDD